VVSEAALLVPFVVDGELHEETIKTKTRNNLKKKDERSMSLLFVVKVNVFSKSD
jgi:hypothetical protein